jgi:hypothetical protein
MHLIGLDQNSALVPVFIHKTLDKALLLDSNESDSEMRHISWASEQGSGGQA